jgi:hypothetical protein
VYTYILTQTDMRTGIFRLRFRDTTLRTEEGRIGRDAGPTTIYLIDSRMLTFSVFSLVRVTGSTRAIVIQNTEA